MRLQRMRRLLFATGLFCATVGIASAQRAAYPDKPIRLLVPNAGASELIARVFGTELNALWGVPVVVDPRPGASGNLALEAAARANPDGHTIYLGTVTTNAISETTFADVLKIKPSRDFAAVTNLVDILAALITHPGVAPQNVAQLIDYAKTNPGKLIYGSAGIGTYPHLDMLRLARAGGFTGTHVPYRTGGAGLVTALIAGEVNAGFANLAASLPHVRAGRLRALAVTTAERLPDLPNVPSMREEGYAGIGTNAWNGLFVPVATPTAVRQQIFSAAMKVMQKPEMRERFAKISMALSLSESPQAYAAFVRAETEKWAAVVRENGVRIE